MTDTMTTAVIEADPAVPIIRITRDFAAPPAQCSGRTPIPRCSRRDGVRVPRLQTRLLGFIGRDALPGKHR